MTLAAQILASLAPTGREPHEIWDEPRKRAARPFWGEASLAQNCSAILSG